MHQNAPNVGEREEISEEIVQNAFKYVNSFIDCSYMKYMEYKMIYHRVVTHNKLCKMKCPCITDIWKQIELWLQNYIGLSSKMNDIDKVSGTKKGNGILDTTILMVKKTIYENRQKRAPNIN